MEQLVAALKKSWKMAIGLGAGLAAGGVIIPRLIWPRFYDSSYPSLPVHALQYFVIGALIGLAGMTFQNYLKEKSEKSE